MAERHVTRLAVSDDTRIALSTLLFEAHIAVNVVSLGLDVISKRAGVPAEMSTLAKYAGQAAEALAGFDIEFRRLFESGSNGHAA